MTNNPSSQTVTVTNGQTAHSTVSSTLQAASSTETPTAGTEGMKYVLDEEWTSDNHTLTLAAAPWEEAMAHLDALDDDGYEYRYFIYNVVETGVEEGTEMTIVDGTTNGEKDLVVENRVPNQKPRLHIRKVDHKGNPLPGAEFSLAKADNREAKAFTITASDGCVYTTEELEDGSYVIHETSAPAGYRLIAPADGTTDAGIYFTVQDMLISMDVGHALPKGVTFDRDTYTLTAVNEPDIQPGWIKVMKRWQNIEGVTYAIENHEATFTVGNTSGVSLPNTGGSGTTLYYVLGSLLALAAVALLIARRRDRA